MDKIVQVAEEEGEQIVELPLEEDGTLQYSTLVKYFPKARGLRYYTEIDTIRGVKLTNGKFHSPHVHWGSTVFYCVFLEEYPGDLSFNCEKETGDAEDNDAHFSIENIECVEMPDVKQEEDSKDNLLTQNFQEIKHESPAKEDNSKKMTKYRTMSSKRPHRCDICGNCFTQQSHMQRHRRIHTGEKPFSCEACGEKFSRSDKLKLHTYKCHAIAKLISESPHHQPHHQSPEVREKREKRPKILDDSYEWGTLPPGTKSRNLTVTFKKNVPVDSDATNGDYYSVVNMAEVRMDDGGDDQKYFDCTECSKVFTKKNQLQRHIRTHTGERPFACKLCDKAFTRIDALKRHMASVGHKKQKELHPEVDDSVIMECDPIDIKNELEFSNGLVISETGEVFNTLGSNVPPAVEYNTLGSNGPSSVEFNALGSNVPPTGDENGDMNDDDDEETSCDVARFAQVTYSNLEHIKSEPEEQQQQSEELNTNIDMRNKQNFCHLCQHTFTNRFNYNRHMKSHDKVSKSYKCTYCQYMFRRQSHLTRHTLIHTGEKPFACTHCGERFSRSDKMKLHVVRLHFNNDTNDYNATITQSIQSMQSIQSICSKSPDVPGEATSIPTQ